MSLLRPKFVPELEPDLSVFLRQDRRIFVIGRNLIGYYLCGYFIFPVKMGFNLSGYIASKLDVHGGVSWNKDHLPSGFLLKLEIPYWCIGFDCAMEYRDLEYCYNELVELEKQIIDLEKNNFQIDTEGSVQNAI